MFTPTCGSNARLRLSNLLLSRPLIFYFFGIIFGNFQRIISYKRVSFKPLISPKDSENSRQMLAREHQTI